MFTSFLPLAALACVALAVVNASEVSSLKQELASAKNQVAKAERLVKRTYTYKPENGEVRHKRAIFRRRKSRWEAEVKSLQAELDSAAPSSSSAAATTVAVWTTQATSSSQVAASSSTTSAAAASSTTEATVAATTTRSAPTTSRLVTSVRTTSTTTAAGTTTSAASSSSTTSADSSSSTKYPQGVKGQKKGLGSNSADLSKAFDLVWWYGWSIQPNGTLSDSVDWSPMCWSDASGEDFAEAAPKWVEKGSKYLLGFNEPDYPYPQADMTIDESVSAWKKYMSPLADSGAYLVSPAVTNGGDPMGLTYLQGFFDACPTCYKETAAINLHWYDSATNVAYFKNYLTNAASQFNRSVILSEFRGSGTLAEQTTFLETVLPWMEDQPFILRYAAFGDFVTGEKDADGNLLDFVDADGNLLALGQTYNSL
ncbi:hypothetical protein JCM8547_000781 [Rhodosporidiobolus lusitaniae]